MKLWKRILLKVPKVGLAYRAYRWYRFTRRYRVVKVAKALRKLKRLLKKVRKEDGTYMEWMEGKKTYAGVAVVLLGLVLSFLGIGGEAEAQELVTNGMTLVGSIIAIYGRWQAKPK